MTSSPTISGPTDRTGSPGPATDGPHRRPVLAIVGAGAAGTLTATHLLRLAGRRSTAVDIVLIDPADRWGRGVAFGTTDDRHLLNVPASGMSAFPEDPGHFVAWRRRELDREVGDAWEFAPRRELGRYLDDTLTRARDAAATLATLTYRRGSVARVRHEPAAGGSPAVTLTLTSGDEISADAAVLAVGLPEIGCAWAPEELRGSPFFVDDPWRPGLIDLISRDGVGPADVLLVGSGLTMVDLAISLRGTRPGRTLRVVSRHSRLPRTHVSPPALPAIPDVSDWGTSLAGIRARAEEHISSVAATTGDWRAGVDGLRYQVAPLWQRLDDDDRERFLREDAGRWGVHRHRMPPTSREAIDRLTASGELTLTAGQVKSVAPLTGGGLLVTLGDGEAHACGWVVNCTGPGIDVRSNPLLADLVTARDGYAVSSLSSAGLGLRTDRGRLVDSEGRSPAPLWTLGALRRGELFESTAVPEIRGQAAQLAVDLLDAVAPLPRRLADGRLVHGHHPVARPRDPHGLPISTTAEAATHFNAGLERLMRLESGAAELIGESVASDPGFALGHAALALLGHESDAETDVRQSLERARTAVRERGDAREASLVEVVRERVEADREVGDRALADHIAEHPRDMLAVSAAVPTIAFSGVTDLSREVSDLLDRLAPAYGDHWWYLSLVAFTRQEQGGFEESALLAESALSCEPSSGHAVHALAHVLYETGRHEEGRVWLDHWVAESGRSSGHRAHFAWHAALHELALADTHAVRRRYDAHLAPDTLVGIRALIDSASLLWRWRLAISEWDQATAPHGVAAAFGPEAAPPAAEPLLGAVGDDLLLRPRTPFIALHSAICLSAAQDSGRLAELAAHADTESALRPLSRTVIPALTAVVQARPAEAIDRLADELPRLVGLGGSAAQHEVIEETLLHCLVRVGRLDEAVAILTGRLDRRPSPLDSRRLAPLAARAGSGRGLPTM